MAVTGVAAGVGALCLIHLLMLLAQSLGRDNHYNQNILIRTGHAVGDAAGGSFRLLQTEMDNSTLVTGGKAPREPVTSEIHSLYIRLYREDTGACVDAILEDYLIIGREGADRDGQLPGLALADSMVSRHHCMLYRRGEQVLIQDLDSTNHTYVNGFQVKGSLPVNQGDRLKIGNAVYQFLCYYVQAD